MDAGNYCDNLLLNEFVPAQHHHCVFCFNHFCGEGREGRKSADKKGCSMIKCTYCGARMHGCKLNDHLENICSKAPSPCPNAGYGCTVRLRRQNLREHLQHCPAFIVHCPFIRNRRFISKGAKKLLKNVSKGRCARLEPSFEYQSSIEAADIALARADQTVLEHFFSLPRPKREGIRLAIQRREVMELKEEHQRGNGGGEGDRDADSSEEEQKAKEHRDRVMREPFLGCRLCKIDPGSQHLHELGSIRAAEFSNNEQSEIGKKASPELVDDQQQRRKDPFDCLPTFHRLRGLFISHDIFMSSVIIDEQYFRENYPIFACNEPGIRRDAYSLHCLAHLAFEDGGSPFIARCPKFLYGCPFLTQAQKPIGGGVIRFNPFLGCSVHVPVPQLPPSSRWPSPTSTGLFLSELPSHFFGLLGPFLDDASLRCLSSTCRRLRDILPLAVPERLSIELRWIRRDEDDGRRRYEQHGLRRFFGVTHRPCSLCVQPLSPIIEHLRHCEYGGVRKYQQERINLRDFIFVLMSLHSILEL